MLFVTLWVSTGCSQPPPDTEKTNAIRQKLGIRTINKDWHYCGMSYREQTWSSGNHGEKKVARDAKGNILWEQDYYYSGRTFTSPDPDAGTCSEMLSLCYDYSIQKFYIGIVTGEKSTEAAIESLEQLPSAPFGYAGTNNLATLTVADEILESWKMSRL